LRNFYEADYKKYLIVPLVLFILFLFLIPMVPFGVDLEGGIILTAKTDHPVDVLKVESAFEEIGVDAVVKSIMSGGVIVEVSHDKNHLQASALFETALSENNEAKARQALEMISVPDPGFSGAELFDFVSESIFEKKTEYKSKLMTAVSSSTGLTDKSAFSIQEVGPSLGASFWESAKLVVIMAFVLVTLSIFAFFRSFVPSMAVVLAMLFDVMGALALMTVFNVELSLASISALLMLIGYSVDTDIVLTTRLLKSRGGLSSEKVMKAMETGLTMTGTTLAAITVLFFVSAFMGVAIISQIAIVLLFGLVADLISTWMMNAPILLWFVEGRR